MEAREKTPMKTLTTAKAAGIQKILKNYKGKSTAFKACCGQIKDKYHVKIVPYYDILCLITTSQGLVPTKAELQDQVLPKNTPKNLVEDEAEYEARMKAGMEAREKAPVKA